MGGGGRGGEDCQIRRNEQPIARPTRDNRNLGLNKLYSNKSVHNSCLAPWDATTGALLLG